MEHKFLDGGADNVTLATLGDLPTLTTLGNFLVRSNSQSSVASASFTVLRLPVQAGHGLQLGDVCQRGDNDYVGVTGTFLGTPSQGVWSTARLDFSMPPGTIAKLHFGAFGPHGLGHAGRAHQSQSSQASSSSGRRSLPPPSFDQLARDIEAA